MSRVVMLSPSKALSESVNAAGEAAVRSAVRGEHETARAWSELAIAASDLLRTAVELQARGGEASGA